MVEINNGRDKEINLEAITPTLTLEQSLQGTFFKYYELYKSWVGDRQKAASQAFELEKLIKCLKEQVKEFEQLEANVREHLARSIMEATSQAAGEIGEEIGSSAVAATKDVTSHLKQVTLMAEQTLTQYEREVKTSQWKLIGTTIVATIASSLLLVWLLIPKPTTTLPLSSEQLKFLLRGKLMSMVWSELSKKEQLHWVDLAKKNYSSYLLDPVKP